MTCDPLARDECSDQGACGECPSDKGRSRSHDWTGEATGDGEGSWRCRCGAVCDHEQPCGRHGACAGRSRTPTERTAVSVVRRVWTPRLWQHPSRDFCPAPPLGWWCSAGADHTYRGTACPTRRARPWERSWWCSLRRKHVLRHRGRCWCGVTF